MLKKHTNSPCDIFTGLYKGEKVFIKIFGHPSGCSIKRTYFGLEGLLYEARFYKKVIPRLRTHCPHFLNYVDFKTKKASFLLDLYEQNKLPVNGYRNLQTYPKVCILILQYLEDWETLNSFLTTKIVSETEDKNIRFQIFFAIDCLQKIRAVHNDLHTDNIGIVKTKKRTTYYFFENKIYKLNTEYMVFIFDFDFLYCEELGYNKNLEEYADIHIRNCFSQKTDIYTLLLYAYPSLLKHLNVQGELIFEKENSVCCQIPEFLFEDIQKNQPYLVDGNGVSVYRINYGYLNKYFDQPYTTFLLVFLKKKRGRYYMVPFSPYEFRMTCIDSRYPTASSLIDYYMRHLIVRDYPEENMIFTVPEQQTPIIYIDEVYAKRGREKLKELGIKPRFPPQKTGYLKIRTKKE